MPASGGSSNSELLSSLMSPRRGNPLSRFTNGRSNSSDRVTVKFPEYTRLSSEGQESEVTVNQEPDSDSVTDNLNDESELLDSRST